jgi:aspartate/methionine/tyrosine aminotransferase
MLLVFSLLINPGDEVVLGTPHYPCYPNFIRICGGTPVFVQTDAARGYPLEVEAVRAALTPRTRAIIVGSPANPTGAVQSAETLSALAELGVPIVSDEIYDGLVYDGAVTSSALELAKSSNIDTYVLDGFSKRYAMTGFRLGWVIAPPTSMRALRTLQQNLFISTNQFVQRAGIAALKDGAGTVASMRETYGKRRRLLVNGLRELGFEVPVVPEGAFYVFADARRFGGDSLKLAFELLETAHVGIAPGIDFGAAGEGWLRFCYAASESAIGEALERLSQVLPSLEARCSVEPGV